jgi:hypothetical protein
MAYLGRIIDKRYPLDTNSTPRSLRKLPDYQITPLHFPVWGRTFNFGDEVWFKGERL